MAAGTSALSDVALLHDDELLAVVATSYAEADQARAAALAALAEVGRRGCWEASGDPSLATWLTRQVPSLSRAQARLEVRMARLLADRRVVLESLASRAMTTGHAELLERVTGPRTVDVLDRDEGLLVSLASQLDLDQYRIAVTQWQVMADPEGSAPDDPTHNRLSIVPVGGRFRLSGDLDAELGAAVTEAVEAQVGRRYRAESSDERTATTPARRRAAALGDLVVRSGPSAGDGPARVAAGAVTVVARLEQLVDAPDARLVETAAGGWVTVSTLRRLACDGSVARVVLGPDDAPINLGRAARLASPAQRRAVLARDGGCAVEGCDAPAWMAEVHHLHHWIDGGATDLDNLAMVCRWHHRRAHSSGWTLARDPDGVVRCRGSTRQLSLTG